MSGRARRYGLATPHRAATEAGRRAFDEGGNAIDAALAAAAVLAVVYPQDCSVGGDLVALACDPQGRLRVVNSTGAAPAHLDEAVAQHPMPTFPATGPLTITVPGVLAGWAALHQLGSRLPWRRALQPAISYAHEGVPVAGATARFLAAQWDQLRMDPGCSSVFSSPTGGPLQESELLRQPALAQTLEEIASDTTSAFYQGGIGERFASGIANLGSPMRATDLADHAALTEASIAVPWMGHTIHTAGPNSQGYVLLQILLAIDKAGLDPDPLGPDAAQIASIVSACLHRRDHCLADPLTRDAPAEPETGEAVVTALLKQAAVAQKTRASTLGGDTVAVVAGDDDGNIISLIQSVYQPFGARILEQHTGILCHNRGAAFTLEAGHPNRARGGRRPAHTLMPVLLEQGGIPIGALGTMGGSAQPQIHSAVLACLLGGMDVAEAVARPRWVLGGREDSSRATILGEPVDGPCLDRLVAAGWTVDELPQLDEAVGHYQAVLIRDGCFAAAADPRSDGSSCVA